MKTRYIVAVVALALALSFSVGARAEIHRSLPDLPGQGLPAVASVAVDWEPQLPDYCGEACFVMALGAFGCPMTQGDIHRASGLRVERGCWSEDLYAAALFLGIEGQYYVVEGLGADARGACLESLKYLLSRGMPVMVSWNEDPSDHKFDTYEHFVLAVGYDDGTGAVTIMDPDLGPPEGRGIPYGELIDHWLWKEHNKGTYGCLMYAIGGMRAGGPAAMGEVEGFLDEGQSIRFAYEAPSPNEYFFTVRYPSADMELRVEAHDGAGRLVGEWDRDYWDSNVFSISGVDAAVITVYCDDGRGEWRLLYEGGRVYPIVEWGGSPPF